jgi:hypothetical protein
MDTIFAIAFEFLAVIDRNSSTAIFTGATNRARKGLP